LNLRCISAFILDYVIIVVVLHCLDWYSAIRLLSLKCAK